MLADALEASANPYMLLDHELRYVWANRAYLAVTGSVLAEIVGRVVVEAFPNDPTDPANEPAHLLRASFEKVLATGQRDVLAAIRYRVPRTVGGALEERVWSATHTPLLGADGRVRFILQHTVEVTELEALRGHAGDRARGDLPPASLEADVLARAHAVQEANSALGEQVAYLRRLFEQTPGFAAVLRGPTHVFELVNPAYTAVVGHRDVVGKTVADGLPEVAGQGFVALLDEVYRTGVPYVGRGVPVTLRSAPDGPLQDLVLDFVYQPIVGPEGSVTGIFVQGNDITEQRRLEQERAELLAAEQAARAEAERANRLKDEFLATVSHELRTPLTAMIGWLQMLRSGQLAEARHAHALETVERNARTQAQLVEDILDVSRIMSGKLHLEVVPVALADVVEAAIESVRPAATAKGIRLQATLDSHAQVLGDPMRLQQIAWNLVANAVKFTPRGGRVQVVVAREGSAAVVRVADTGQGIAAEFLPFVFERFRQADGGITRRFGGLGLGLAIVKHLAEQHGGTILADSEGEGRGATFTVRLPVSPARTTAPRRPETARALPLRPELVGLVVVVVDDEPDTRELLREVLEGAGMTVHVASGTREALARVRDVRPDLVVSDLGMPDEDGFAFVQQLRALPEDEGGRIPAVALTALARTEDRTRALLAGFRAHVPKPIDLAELLAVLVSLAPVRG